MSKTKLYISAQLLYVIAIAWYVAAVGCFMRGVSLIGAVAAGMGTIHFIWAVIRDRKETKAKKDR